MTDLDRVMPLDDDDRAVQRYYDHLAAKPRIADALTDLGHIAAACRQYWQLIQKEHAR